MLNHSTRCWHDDNPTGYRADSESSTPQLRSATTRRARIEPAALATYPRTAPAGSGTLSYRLMHMVWRHSQSTGAARAVLLCLAARADHLTGECWLSEATLARNAGVTDRTVRRAIRTLASLGELSARHGPRYANGQPGPDACNRYRLTIGRGDVVSTLSGAGRADMVSGQGGHGVLHKPHDSPTPDNFGTPYERAASALADLAHTAPDTLRNAAHNLPHPAGQHDNNEEPAQ